MTQADKELLLKDLCGRIPYGVKCQCFDERTIATLTGVKSKSKLYFDELDWKEFDGIVNIDYCKPYLFPLSSMTDEEHAIYFKIWEDTGKMAYLDGCHPLIINIKAYKTANDYLLSKHYDINRLIPMGLAIDATGLNIY